MVKAGRNYKDKWRYRRWKHWGQNGNVFICFVFIDLFSVFLMWFILFLFKKRLLHRWFMKKGNIGAKKRNIKVIYRKTEHWCAGEIRKWEDFFFLPFNLVQRLCFFSLSSSSSKRWYTHITLCFYSSLIFLCCSTSWLLAAPRQDQKVVIMGGNKWAEYRAWGRETGYAGHKTQSQRENIRQVRVFIVVWSWHASDSSERVE